MQFVDGSSRLLSTSDRDSSPGWFAKEDTKPGAAKSLRMFMESFVIDKFLPEIYLDFRSATPQNPFAGADVTCLYMPCCSCGCKERQPCNNEGPSTPQ